MSDDEDLVKYLRDAFPDGSYFDKIAAADAIERLTRERDEYHADREHFAKLAFVDLGANPPVAWKDRAEAAERKIEVLREAIRSAYVEGWTDATSRDDPRGPGVIDQEWETSLARAALDELENK